MQCQSLNSQLTDLPYLSDGLTGVTGSEGASQEGANSKPVNFQAQFAGFMEMYGDARTVASYLDAHESWFSQCARPMVAEPIDDNGYLLTLGHFGALGYDVEAKIALMLQSPKDCIYQMYSIPHPEVSSASYEVDYRASLELREIASREREIDSVPLPESITQVEWELHLTITVQFPRFIQKLPLTLIQKAGDRLLGQIVGQISPRLTQKVQRDFHARLGLPLPPKNSRSYWHKRPGDRESNLV